MITYDEALHLAKSKYPMQDGNSLIKDYEEYKKYFIFGNGDLNENCIGGCYSPVVIRKEDGACLNYSACFWELMGEKEISSGKV